MIGVTCSIRLVTDGLAPKLSADITRTNYISSFIVLKMEISGNDRNLGAVRKM